MELITSKAQFCQLAAQGLCGNTVQTWATVDEALSDPRQFARLGVRGMSYGQTNGTTPGIPRDELKTWVKSHGLRPGEYVVSAVPTREVGPGLQGELSVVEGLLTLYYAERRGYQRAVLAVEGRQVSRYDALWKLKQWLPPHEVEELLDLLDLYTIDGRAPVIEFAQTDRIGRNPNREVIIWEIRHR